MSQHARPRIEPAFGWLKTIGWMRKVKLRGLEKVEWLVVFASAGFNLIRFPETGLASNDSITQQGGEVGMRWGPKGAI